MFPQLFSLLCPFPGLLGVNTFPKTFHAGTIEMSRFPPFVHLWFTKFAPFFFLSDIAFVGFFLLDTSDRSFPPTLLPLSKKF